MWAQNLLAYRTEIQSDVELFPVSFDRRNYISGNTSTAKRLFCGVKELSSAIRNAKKKMKEIKYDVVHICTSASFSLIKDIILLRYARKRGVKSALHLHFGRVPQLIEQKNWEWRLMKKAISLATVVVTMDMKSYGVLNELCYNNIEYCPNPLSMDIINQIEKEKANITRIPNKLLFIGHVVPTKGVYELVEACKSFDGVELDIIGKVEESVKKDLLNKAIKDNSTSWIHFLGEIPHSRVIRHLLSSSMFVFPSYTEGFPNVILEAMACGTPIVASSVGAIPEMLDVNNTDKYGICVEPKDVPALVDGVNKMLSDKEYALQCGINARSRVNELYAIPVVWNRLVEIWR